MPAYDEYPQFDGLSSSEMLHLIIEARLSRTDIQIAACKRNPEYANGMLDAWKAIHAEMRVQSAKVAAMINQYK